MKSLPDALRVYQVQPAPAALAGWVQALLTPALRAMRAEGRPLEFRPTGLWGGWSSGSRCSNPDGRISVSTKAVFWSKNSLLKLYVHELAHCIADEAEEKIEGKETFCHGHDAAFLAINLTLLMRLDLAPDLGVKNPTSYANSIGFYDLQDPPNCWENLPRSKWQMKALQWAIEQAEKWAPNEANALDAAVEICRDYWTWCDEVAGEPERLKATAFRLKNDQEKARLELKKERDDKQLFQWATALFAVGFFGLVYSRIH